VPDPAAAGSAASADPQLSLPALLVLRLVQCPAPQQERVHSSQHQLRHRRHWELQQQQRQAPASLLLALLSQAALLQVQLWLAQQQLLPGAAELPAAAAAGPAAA
jgi:hypothetical protein